jgi:hypothetical protein
MSQVLGLCEDSDDNGVPSLLYTLPLSRKRHRDKEESSNDDHPRKKNGRKEKGPGNKNATDSAELVVDLQLADDNGTASVPSLLYTLPLSRKRPRDKEESSSDDHPRKKNGPGNKNATDSTELVVDLQLADEVELPVSPHRKRWEDRLSELADYRKIHGHCNVPTNYSANAKLGKWVRGQRRNHRLHLEGKASPMTKSRIQELESVGFEWDSHSAAWEYRLSELADYRKIKGHCNVPYKCTEYAKLAKWVTTQRYQYRLHLEGKKTHMTKFRIQELESLGFEWGGHSAAWEYRLSELADYRKIHGHCNVPQKYSETTKKLGKWVVTQRTHYRLHREGKKSPMTKFRIQELESLGFEWKPSVGLGKRTPKKPSIEDDACS